MSEQTIPPGIVGEIKGFAGVFAPVNWALCDGQLLQIAAASALYKLIGTAYGGDGEFNFAVPDLRGRFPLAAGRGGGLLPRIVGQKGGTETVALTSDEMPEHNHNVLVSPDAPEGKPATLATPENSIYNLKTPDVVLNEETISETGGGRPHENMPPYLAFNWIICVNGGVPTEPPK